MPEPSLPRGASAKAALDTEFPSFSVVIVESLIAVLIVVAGFEYDRWRRESETFTVYERFSVLFVFAVLLYTMVYTLFHRRMSIFGVLYRAPTYGG